MPANCPLLLCMRWVMSPRAKDVSRLKVACLGIGEGRKEVEFFNRLRAKRKEKNQALFYVDINYQMILRAARRMAESQGGEDADRLKDLRFVHTDFDTLKPDHLFTGVAAEPWRG